MASLAFSLVVHLLVLEAVMRLLRLFRLRVSQSWEYKFSIRCWEQGLAIVIEKVISLVPELQQGLVATYLISGCVGRGSDWDLRVPLVAVPAAA